MSKSHVIHLVDLGVYVGGRVLFADTSLTLSGGNRYGVVGANGCGKSTLLRVIAGEEESSTGDVAITKGSKLGWLKQDQHLYDDEPVLKVVMRGNLPLWKAFERKERLLKVEEWTDEVSHQLSDVEEEIDRLDGYSAEAFAQQLLCGLGIEEDKHHAPMRALSGGYRLRVLLARALYDKPDILLLDEPTNYLDIVSIMWLENYLRNDFQGLLMFVSHDQKFLNRLSTHVLDIDYGEIREYPGNYSHFLQQKEVVGEQKAHLRKHAEAKVARLREFVEKNRYKPTKARQAMSREKMIERIEMPELDRTSRISPQFIFRQRQPSGRRVLHVKGLGKSYGDKTVLEDVDLEIFRGERVAILGKNGIGKSTLVKILTGRLEADAGTFEWGHNASPHYFAQEHREMLQEEMSVYDWFSHQDGGHADLELRQKLGQVLFGDAEVNKSILTLSGGEAARLLLARLMLLQGNVMVLDEPTNHLDLEAISALSKGLQNYPGTLLIVSHDREFLSQVAERFIVLTEIGPMEVHRMEEVIQLQP